MLLNQLTRHGDCCVCARCGFHAVDDRERSIHLSNHPAWSAFRSVSNNAVKFDAESSRSLCEFFFSKPKCKQICAASGSACGEIHRLSVFNFLNILLFVFAGNKQQQPNPPSGSEIRRNFFIYFNVFISFSLSDFRFNLMKNFPLRLNLQIQ